MQMSQQERRKLIYWKRNAEQLKLTFGKFQFRNIWVESMDHWKKKAKQLFPLRKC